ncbi:ferredoxin [Kitasatospora cheerisanensis]|uniref:Ferredoxin n=1 Tax=Kitasatospora cheerisanensis KCTC 2395 TaxID=1348663 RepID=A0A066Z0J3_9ACTN|nr:ferredoxin [Kitasatospora cheerisanensis]KDN83866.1 ferredoxin [Kitasatospora cheerisanensis KCTC 2395]
MLVQIDQELCCGAGSCVRTAPEVFDQRDEDGLVLVIDEKPPAHLHDAVREAADICPAAAILLDEQDA